MDVVQESAEHHFLTFLGKEKEKPRGWQGMRLMMGALSDHDEIISVPAHIRSKLKRYQTKSDELLAVLKERASSLKNPVLYQFCDYDLVLMAQSDNDADGREVQRLHQEMIDLLGNKRVELLSTRRNLRACEKLADKKFIAEKRMAAYHAMSDSNKVASIDIRRKRHEDPVVLMVEDDRFTASLAANMLTKDYDFLIAKTGEEAIALYIEHCPDIVYLDIHLPGIDGLKTLKALKIMDPDAYVVMLSVDSVKQNIVTANKEGASGFVKKPFTKERLQALTARSPHVRAAIANRPRSPLAGM